KHEVSVRVYPAGEERPSVRIKSAVSGRGTERWADPPDSPTLDHDGGVRETAADAFAEALVVRGEFADIVDEERRGGRRSGGWRVRAPGHGGHQRLLPGRLGVANRWRHRYPNAALGRD